MSNITATGAGAGADAGAGLGAGTGAAPGAGFPGIPAGLKFDGTLGALFIGAVLATL
jgi:hypothetical protein